MNLPGLIKMPSDFQTQECKNSHPCAGTCTVCDEEIRYINQELNKIPPEQRIYYEKYTGKKNDVVLENLRKLSNSINKEKILVRVPRIPEYNEFLDVIRTKWKVQMLGLDTEVFTYNRDFCANERKCGASIFARGNCNSREK